MRFVTKAAITAAFAAPTIAALMLTGAGPASAAVTTPTAHTTSTWAPYCNRHQLEEWNLNGYNTVDVSWNGASYAYTVHFNQRGSCLSGWLTDPNIPNGPTTGPVQGTVSGNHVTFSFTYTYNGETQGTRTYNGYIGWNGNVSGYFYQSGPQTPNHGTWSLQYRAQRACPRYVWWARYCPVPFYRHF
jgi:hypothetical protein